MANIEFATVQLNNGLTVLARAIKGKPAAHVFMNRKQAQAAANRCNGTVTHSWPFYVRPNTKSSV